MIDRVAPADNTPTITAPPAQRASFEPDKIDGYAALLAFVVGFLFVRYVLLSWNGIGVTLFTFTYAAFAVFYLTRRGYRLGSESIFWLGILLSTGFSYSLWMSQGLRPWRELFLFLTAVYFVLVTAKITLFEGTSDWLPLDGLHGLVVVPFGNFLAQARSVAALRSKDRRAQSGRQVPWR
jgi:hypothetical protein